MQIKIIKKIIFTLIIVIITFMYFFKSTATSKINNDFYNIAIKSIDGKDIDLNKYKEKVILLVNVASYCGFTKQYTDLQNLWEKYQDKGFVVIGVPSNSFNQEKNTEKEIKNFCDVNFNINFPMTSIFDVKGENAHELYKWAKLNYGKSTIPKWNFHKILINKEGNIVDTFLSFTSPVSKKIINKIEEVLN
tara:strand:+ start:564 stop:1136 length:573 start_codon:yes stop_codon:yes gene_type:complete